MRKSIPLYNASILEESNDYIILELKIPQKPEGTITKQTYYIDYAKPLGEGLTSEVYRAYYCDNAKKRLTHIAPLAVKVFKNEKHFREEEFEIHANYYKNIQLCKVNRYALCLMSDLSPPETPQKNKLYVDMQGDTLNYAIETPTGEIKLGSINQNELQIDFTEFKDLEKLQPLLPKILQIIFHNSQTPTHNRYFAFSEYLPEESLHSYLNKRLAEGKPYDLKASLQIACGIAAFVNTLHNETPQTGPAVLHRDLKTNNIIIQKDPRTKQPKVHIIDFGFSRELDDANPDLMMEIPAIGTLGYMPIEVVKTSQAGVKSDIYSLTPIMIEVVLGVINPFRDKDIKIQQLIVDKLVDSNDKRRQEELVVDIPFNMGYENDPRLPSDIIDLIKIFYTRMQSLNPRARPNSEELLRFHISLYNLFLIIEKNPNDPSAFPHLAKLILLAHGFWYIPLINPGNGEEVKTFEHFNFTGFDKVEIENKNLFYKTIAALNINSLLNEQLIILLAKENNTAKLYKEIILTLQQKNSLNATILSSIDEENIEKWHIIILYLNRNRWLTPVRVQLIIQCPNFLTILIQMIRYTTLAVFDSFLLNPAALQDLSQYEISRTTINAIYTSMIPNANERHAFVKKLPPADINNMHRFFSREPNLTGANEINDQKRVLDFINCYNKVYRREFFKNPFSKMRKKIAAGEIQTFTDITKYANENTTSRTSKILRNFQ